MTDGQPLIERPKSPAAELLRKMADQIDASPPESFGGAAVIVPPQDAGDPIEVLILDPKKNAGQFYATVQTRLQFEMGELQEKQQRTQAWGQGRR